MEYNKFSGRTTREQYKDIRRKQREGDIFPNDHVDALIGEIISLKKQLVEKDSQPVNTGEVFTAEQVDEMINKAVVESVEEALNSSAGYMPPVGELEKLKGELKLKDIVIDALKGQNTGLEQSNNNMDEDIQELKSMLAETAKKLEILTLLSHEGKDYYDPDRPQMEEVFIDPSEKDKEFESHIEIKDENGSGKASFNEQANKLKGMFGNKIPQ